MAIEIVDLPMKIGGSFQFAMLNYQRVHSEVGFCPAFVQGQALANLETLPTSWMLDA